MCEEGIIPPTLRATADVNNAARGMYESLCLFFFVHIYRDLKLQCNYLSLKLTDINSRKR